MRYFVAMIAAVVWLIWPIPTPAQKDKPIPQDKAEKAENRTRVFPDDKCQFTLPKTGWSWVDDKKPDLLCMAKDRRGYVVNLSVQKLPQPTELKQGFVDTFEKSFYSSSARKFNKRMGRYLTFKGLEAYQTEAVSSDGKNAVSRVVLAHDRSYNITVIGGKIAFDREPDFEKTMQHFEFTEKPQTAETTVPMAVPLPMTDPEGYFKGFFSGRRRIGGTTVVLLLVAGLVAWYFRKSAYTPGGM
jgi:hypothetical protein